MVTFTLDSKMLTVPVGTTLLAAARSQGVDVPTLCHHDAIEPGASCMLCVVEDVETGALHPACATVVRPGMRIATASAAVIEARQAALALLLGDHVGDCEGPCRLACAAGLDIPAMLHAIAAGDWQTAIRVIKTHIALPATLGRICPAPCEKVCRRGRLDRSVAICEMKRRAADRDLASDAPYVPTRAAPSGLRVAIVGGGPAGLSAAWTLWCAGHACTVYDRAGALGGGLRTTALADQLPAGVLNAEIDRITALGMDVVTGVTIGADIALDALKRDHTAVLLACGAGSADEAIRLGLPGHVVGAPPYRTVDPRVWVCGAGAHPGRLAVRAVGEGRLAALAVDQMLRGVPVTAGSRRYNHRIPGTLGAAELAALAAAADRVGGEDDGAEDEALRAVRESARCLHCECRKASSCRLREAAEANRVAPGGWRSKSRRDVEIRRSGNVVYEPGKCIACGICVRISEANRRPSGLTFVGRGFDVRVATPFDAPLTQALGEVASACVNACPTGALAFGARPRVSVPSSLNPEP